MGRSIRLPSRINLGNYFSSSYITKRSLISSQTIFAPYDPIQTLSTLHAFIQRDAGASLYFRSGALAREARAAEHHG